MKNKKLFAILTLVCFMFTLMPVAAFAGADTYAEVDKEFRTVTLTSTGADVKLNVKEAASGDVFTVFAYKNGDLYGKLNGSATFVEFAAAELTNDAYTVKVSDAGEYQFVVVDAQLTADEKTQLLFNSDRVKLLTEKNNMTMSVNDKATVVAPTAQYDITASAVPTLSADSGFVPQTVTVRLMAGTKGVSGQDLTIRTNSSALVVSADKVTTNPGGYAEFDVYATLAGNFKIYVEYGTRAKEVIDVTVDALAPAVITTVAEPAAPVALNSDISASGIRFAVTDANGNAITDATLTTTPADVKVSVTAPAGSAVKDGIMAGLTYDAAKDNYKLTGGVSFDREGDYTFRVALQNGSYAVAKVTVKEFQTPVAVKVAYPVATVELDGVLAPEAIYFVDENGVVKYIQGNLAAEGVELSANGYAVANFNAATGEVKAKANESYVGSKITVMAVCSEYSLVSAEELVVANEAAGVKYASTKADVAVNNTLVANIVDADGNKVALNSVATASEIQYIVLDKPANSKVAVSTKSDADLAAKGEFKVSFTASEIGTYKLQTVVRYEQATGVVKYYSGIEEITVGNTGFKDIVVMSVGSNEIVVNAETVAIDAAPVVENNRTFVPFRALIQAFGAEVAYDEATQAVTAELNGTTVVMTIGSAEYTVNGVAKTADVAPFINGSRTMVPVRFVAEEFGIKVTPTYDENGATADILFAK